MIPLAVPIAFAVLALVAWRYDARARRAYEVTLSPAEKLQFRALRRINPLRWRAAIALKQAEAAVTASQDVEPREPKKISQRPNPPRHSKRETKNKPRKRRAGAKSRPNELP
jgi:hypothetical protein